MGPTLPGDDLYRAHRDFGLTGVIAERYNSTNGATASYYAVAVVKAASCEDFGGLAGLKVGAT